MKTKYMQLAIHLAIGNARTLRGGPFAAIVVRGDEIVATGVNRVTTDQDPTAHAEVVAIREACSRLGQFELSDCELYTTCEPCPMCLGAIYWAHLPTVYYACSREDAAAAGFDDDFIYAELAKPLERRSIRMVQFERQEGLTVFDQWKTLEGKVPY